MEDQWTKYLSKSGETLFVYNKTTGEHRWLAEERNSLINDIELGQPILCQELFSVSTQTDDTGCINGCTSAEANAGCISSKATVIQVQMDDLEMQRQSINNSGFIGSHAINTINVQSHGVQDVPMQYEAPRTAANHYVPDQSSVATPMEVQVCDASNSKDVGISTDRIDDSVIVNESTHHATTVEVATKEVQSTTMPNDHKISGVHIVTAHATTVNTVVSTTSSIVLPTSSTKMHIIPSEVNNNDVDKHSQTNSDVSHNTIPVSTTASSIKNPGSNVSTIITTSTYSTGGSTAVTTSHNSVTIPTQVNNNIAKSAALPPLKPILNQVLPPSQNGYVGGALYLGNGKFVNVLIPADKVQRGANMPLLGYHSSLPQIAASKPVLNKAVPGVRAIDTTTNKGSGVKAVSTSNVANIVYPQLSSAFSLNSSITNAANVVHVPNGSLTASKSVDQTVLNGHASNVNYPSKEDSQQPQHCVISNVFSYATNNVLTPQPHENGSSSSSAAAQPNVSPSPSGEKTPKFNETPDGITIVKIEPIEPDGEIITEVHKCMYCCKTFVHHKDMILHQKVHSGERGHRCPECDKEFRHSSSLKVHMKLHTGEKPYKCCSCDRTFRQKVHLRNHLRVHTENTRFNCSYCEKSFRHKSELYDHLAVHADRLPYKCSICNRAFAQKNHLESHEQSHAEKKDVCPYCNKEFRFGSSLNLHLRTHTGEKPFKCSLCDLTFRQKQHLIVHVRRHTGERPFKCVHCNKAFRHDTALRSHLLIHPESKYSKLQAAMFTEEQRKGTVETDAIVVAEQSKEPTEEAAMYREKQRIEIAIFMEEQRKRNVEAAMSKLNDEHNRQTIAVTGEQRNNIVMMDKSVPDGAPEMSNDAAMSVVEQAKGAEELMKETVET